MTKLALCIGLTEVDPEAYNGWDGPCPGCDTDVIGMLQLCCENDFNGTCVLTNSIANFDTVSTMYKNMVSNLKPDDLMVIHYSGHGGQVPDFDGDESDGLDETMCWYDGQVTDDIIYQILEFTPPGVRVFLITDSCHSETVFRTIPRQRVRSNIQLLHFAGCADDLVSYGTESGGYFNNALLKTFNEKLTYKEWFNKAKNKIKGQKPIMNSLGESFANRLVLT